MRNVGFSLTLLCATGTWGGSANSDVRDCRFTTVLCIAGATTVEDCVCSLCQRHRDPQVRMSGAGEQGAHVGHARVHGGLGPSSGRLVLSRAWSASSERWRKGESRGRVSARQAQAGIAGPFVGERAGPRIGHRSQQPDASFSRSVSPDETYCSSSHSADRSPASYCTSSSGARLTTGFNLSDGGLSVAPTHAQPEAIMWSGSVSDLRTPPAHPPFRLSNVYHT